MMEQHYLELGMRMRLRRRELHLTQKELAALCHVSANHISAMESAKEKPSLDMLILLCDALRTTPDFLLLGSIHAKTNSLSNLADKLRLCSPQDIALASEFIELLITRNSKAWNRENYI